ncbi:MAG: hypothetical protein WBI07_13465 [Mobilitalea sp.]
MKNKMLQFFKESIQCLQKEGVNNPVKVISPLIQNINHSQFNKLVGHINTCSDFQLSYSNQSAGYNEGCMTALFKFPTSRPKMYQFNFAAMLKGDYDKDEWWLPLVSCRITEDIGNEIAFRGMQNDFLQFENELIKELNNEEEITKLKQNIADMQRRLAIM